MTHPSSDEPTRPRRFWLRKSLIFFYVAIALLAYASFNYFGGFGGRTPKQLASNLPFSAETTIYTSPVDENGFVNFVDAFYSDIGKGITPENNAAYEIIKAFGGRGSSGQVIPDACEFLNIEPAGEQDDFFRSVHEYGNQIANWEPAELSDIYEEQDLALSEPWATGTHPHMDEWLASNAASLELIKEASKKNHYFVHRSPAGGAMVTILLDDIQKLRSVARCLAVSAMNKCGNEDYEGAWSDIQAMYRLARLTSGCPFLVERLVGYAINGIAHHTTVAWLNSLPDNYQGLAEKRIELDQLAPLDSISNGIRCERTMAIDSVIGTLKNPEGFEGIGVQQETMTRLGQQALDWELILTQLNEAYDAVEEGYAHETYAEQKAAMKSLTDKISQTSQEVKDRYKNPLTHLRWALIPGARRQEASEILANIFIALLLPACEPMINVGRRSESEWDLVKVAFVMTEYRFQNGRLPVTFQEAGLPNKTTPIVDQFDGQPFRISPDGPDHVWLWQIGFDGVDESQPAIHHELTGMDFGFRLGPAGTATGIVTPDPEVDTDDKSEENDQKP